jgi:hypothetical protein
MSAGRSLAFVVSMASKCFWREQVVLTREREEGFFEMTRASMTELIDDLTTAAIH